ncbi:MAG: hypothetical protein ACRDF4_12175 [Rhabdochlamydiaceae bacterium]
MSIGIGIGIEIPAESYHAEILTSARIAEQNRARVYTRKQSEMLILTRQELLYLQGAEYKLNRVELQTKEPVKALDDIRDAYNYCALLFRDLKQRYPLAYEELLKQS